MKYKTSITLFLLMTLLAGAPISLAGPPQASSPQALFKKSLTLTQQGNYGSALGLLNKAKTLYSQQGNAEGAYRCAALAYYVNFEKQTVATRGRNRPPDWMRAGWLMRDFNYSGTYIIPPIPSKSYQGLFLLTRKVRDISQGPGRSVPIWGVLDVQAVPRLKPGEIASGGHCELRGKQYNPEIAAVIMAKGHRNEEKFKDIRKAWRLNTRTGKIEELPNKQVVCVNEGWGV